MSQSYKTVYEVASYFQNDHHISEWDIGCFIKLLDKIISSLIAKLGICRSSMSMDVEKNPHNDNEYKIYARSADNQETIQVKINGNTISVVPPYSVA